MGWNFDVALGGKNASLTFVKPSTCMQMGRAVINNQQYATLLTLKMLIQLVNPGFKKGGSHPGLFC
jgi:hypothetical protein